MAHGHRDFTPHGRALVLVLWWLGHILQRKRKVHLALVCPVPSMRRPDRRMPCVRSTAVKTQKSKLILSDELLRFSWYAGGGGAGGYTPLRPHVQPPPAPLSHPSRDIKNHNHHEPAAASCVRLPPFPDYNKSIFYAGWRRPLPGHPQYRNDLRC